MYAVIENGGKQYRVAAGESIEFETMAGEVGAEVEFGRVIALVDGDSVKAGAGARGQRHHRRAWPRRKDPGLQVQAQEAVQAHHWTSAELHASHGRRDRRIGIFYGT